VIQDVQIYFLIFARIFALLIVAPLISSRAVPGIARIGLTLFVAVSIFPWVKEMGYPIPELGLSYGFLVIGEALVGIILGFILVLIHSAFQVAGQFFSLQMGFGASQVYDPLSQVSMPLMGQLFYIMGMYIFVAVDGFQKLFLSGVYRSFNSIRAVDLVNSKDPLVAVILRGLGGLFEQALIISFPVLGTLFLISVTMGLMSKAAPQMNLLMMGFPISIGVAFLIIFLSMPFIVEAFAKIIEGSLEQIIILIDRIREASTP
jgi:flagellar biosynthesis protein FliR